MKANRKFLQDNKAEYNLRMIGGIVSLLIAIIIGVMVYFEVTDSIPALNERTETFTGYINGTSNASAWSVTLLNSPAGSSNTNVTCYDGNENTENFPTFGLNHETINVAADAAQNFTQVNVTYTSNIANTESESITPMASTVFGLLPIVGLVVVASVILGVILAFGGGKSKT